MCSITSLVVDRGEDYSFEINTAGVLTLELVKKWPIYNFLWEFCVFLDTRVILRSLGFVKVFLSPTTLALGN